VYSCDFTLLTQLLLCKESLRAVSDLQSAYLTQPMVTAVQQLSLMCLEYNIVLEQSFVGIRGSEAADAAARNGMPQMPGILNWNFRTAISPSLFWPNRKQIWIMEELCNVVGLYIYIYIEPTGSNSVYDVCRVFGK